MSAARAEAEAPPEPDRIEGAPHPRETQHLFGQDAAQAAFLEAFNAERLHHAWLLTGPRGVGKATLAWSIARFLLATPMPASGGMFDAAPAPATTLAIAPDHPVARRILARSESGLFHITRSPSPDTGRMRQVIAVDNIRAMFHFLSLSATDGGRRVIIVDAADDMNVNAANALLKALEEPPANTIMLLVSHAPLRLLPTIRSRCRQLRLAPMGPEDVAAALHQAGHDVTGDAAALAELTAGSVGEAIRLIELGGLAIYGEIIALFERAPQVNRQRALKLAEAAAQRGGEARRDLLFWLFDRFLARLARTGATGAPPMVEAAPGEAALMARLSPDPARARKWAEAAEELGTRARHGLAVNLDPAALVLDTVFKIAQTAPRT